MTKHTLGPWYEDDGAINAKWETGEEIQVALAWGTRWSQPDGGKNKRMREESKANVRLIAAAPELLEALKIAYPYVVDRAADSVHKRVEAAIAKAESTT